MRLLQLAVPLCAALAGCAGPRAERVHLLEGIAARVAPPPGAPADLAGAAAELERYLARHPAEAKRPEMASLRALLGAGAAGPGAGGPGLAAEVERLARENEELRAVVERLKALDMDMERRRREVR